MSEGRVPGVYLANGQYEARIVCHGASGQLALERRCRGPEQR